MASREVSHYRIIETIGSGGMGVVYKAQDTRLGRIVALKFLPPGVTRDETAKRRFLREAQAASLLDHPNICNIYEIDESPDGQLFISMAYYEGMSVKERIEKPLSPREAFEIIYSIADGLACAHDRGIVHRDIKPSNVMITTDGFVKILDFGLAKLAGRSRVTRSGTTPGTLAYMSPEQVSGKDVDARTDLWSLGVVAYEALAGKTPFLADAEPAVMYKILHDPPAPMREARSNVPPDLEAVVMKCLEKDPADRYATAHALIDDLVAVGRKLGWQSSGTVRTVMRVGSERSASRRRLVAMTIALLALVVLLPFSWRRIAKGPFTDVRFTTELRLASMPIENLARGEVSDEFVNGLSEWLVNHLERMSQIHESMWVVPFHRTEPSLLPRAREAKSAFGVNRVLTFNIQRFGTGYRLVVELVEAGSLRRLERAEIDYDLEHASVLQTVVAERVAELLDIKLDAKRRAALAAGSTR